MNVPAVEAALQEYETVQILLDLTEFKWEKAEAWGADWKFGRQFHQKIGKMAIVGDKTWEKWLAKVAAPSMPLRPNSIRPMRLTAPGPGYARRNSKLSDKKINQGGKIP